MIADPQSVCDHIRRDRVFVAVNERVSRVYAGMYPGGGDLYEVEPLGDLEPDADLRVDDPISFQVAAARVRRVLARGIQVEASMDEIRAWLARTEPAVQRVGRNDPCPCGSGRKSKRCCRA